MNAEAEEKCRSVGCLGQLEVNASLAVRTVLTCQAVQSRSRAQSSSQQLRCKDRYSLGPVYRCIVSLRVPGRKIYSPALGKGRSLGRRLVEARQLGQLSSRCCDDARVPDVTHSARGGVVAVAVDVS